MKPPNRLVSPPLPAPPSAPGAGGEAVVAVAPVWVAATAPGGGGGGRSSAGSSMDCRVSSCEAAERSALYAVSAESVEAAALLPSTCAAPCAQHQRAEDRSTPHTCRSAGRPNNE